MGENRERRRDCNAHKGPNLTAIDPASGGVVPLFNPCTDIWNEYFRNDEALILGLTHVGRATAALLHMNARERVDMRVELRREGAL